MANGENPLEDQLVALSVDERDLDSTSVLVLWFLRNVLFVDPLDSYEYVFGEARPNGIDGFFVEGDDAGRERVDLIVAAARDNGSPEDLRERLTSARELSREVAAFRPDESRPDIPRALLLHLIEKSRAAAPVERRVRIALVSDVDLHRDIAELATAEGIDVFGRDYLERQAAAISSPSLVDKRFVFECEARERLTTTIDAGEVLVCPVPAMAFPDQLSREIEDRTLFDLNVRFELGRGRVRRSLDAALKHSDDHGNFLAFHNGLTIVCGSFESTNGEVTVDRISVVNGAQSVIAFSANRSHLDATLRVVCKFVAVGADDAVAREIAIRSNTQNPVTARNLRALDPRQLVLREEFADRYPRFDYQTRPDQRDVGRIEIPNDYAAQLICAIYTEEPWLAVKRDTLFGPQNYARIFRPEIRAPHIVVCHYIRQSVEGIRDSVPEAYRSSWALTALTGVYVVGQLLRTDDVLQAVLEQPEEWADRERDLLGLLEPLSEHACGTLCARREMFESDPERIDDFKVDFKRETYLRRLGAEASLAFRTRVNG